MHEKLYWGKGKMRNNWFRKGLVIGIIVLFIGMSINSSTGRRVEMKSTTQTLRGNTLYVGGIGPGNYTTIQNAIDNASDGDTVFVYAYSSPYYENVLVNRSINLIGEDKNTTIIDGSDKMKFLVNIDVPYVTATDIDPIEITTKGFIFLRFIRLR